MHGQQWNGAVSDVGRPKVECQQKLQWKSWTCLGAKVFFQRLTTCNANQAGDLQQWKDLICRAISTLSMLHRVVLWIQLVQTRPYVETHEHFLDIIDFRVMFESFHPHIAVCSPRPTVIQTTACGPFTILQTARLPFTLKISTTPTSVLLKLANIFPPLHYFCAL